MARVTSWRAGASRRGSEPRPSEPPSPLVVPGRHSHPLAPVALRYTCGKRRRADYLWNSFGRGRAGKCEVRTGAVWQHQVCGLCFASHLDRRAPPRPAADRPIRCPDSVTLIATGDSCVSGPEVLPVCCQCAALLRCSKDAPRRSPWRATRPPGGGCNPVTRGVRATIGRGGGRGARKSEHSVGHRRHRHHRRHRQGSQAAPCPPAAIPADRFDGSTRQASTNNAPGL